MRQVITVSLLAITAILAGAPQVRSQEVVWDASFDFFFDNREYKNNKLNWSQTIAGARLAPEIGIRWDKKHTIMGGVNLLANLGAKPVEEGGNEVFFYYQYLDKKFKAYAGVVPRRKLIGDYGYAFFSDSIRYYDPHITGLLFQHSSDRFLFEFASDWNSMQGRIRREEFMLFSYARFNIDRSKKYHLGYMASMFHHAGSKTFGGVVDQVFFYPHGAAELGSYVWLDELSLRAGWLVTAQNDRTYVGKYVNPGGLQVELGLGKCNFGIHNTFYVGDNLMPYYQGPEGVPGYGSGLYWGEPFYRTNDLYNRLELFWEPDIGKGISLRVSSVHHYDGSEWGWQQKIIFSATLGQRRLLKQ